MLLFSTHCLYNPIIEERYSYETVWTTHRTWLSPGHETNQLITGNKWSARITMTHTTAMSTRKCTYVIIRHQVGIPGMS